jgi:mannose-6-phosphate isomerase
MDNIFYGGNLIKNCKLGNPGKQLLGSGPYEFFFYETELNDQVVFDELRSFSVYVYDKPASVKLSVDGLQCEIMQGDLIQAENVSVRLSVNGGAVKLLVAGTKEPHPEKKGLFFSSHNNIYKVDKPWGHELWINGQHPRYALKQIYLKAGNKTSLQYHNFKQETNVLFQGRTNLHYKINKSVKNDNVQKSDLAQIELSPITSIDVVPGVLHRLEAITDLILYETSTPHLDDVIRVSDDSNRSNGRIIEEHSR